MPTHELCKEIFVSPSNALGPSPRVFIPRTNLTRHIPLCKDAEATIQTLGDHALTGHAATARKLTMKYHTPMPTDISHITSQMLGSADSPSTCGTHAKTLRPSTCEAMKKTLRLFRIPLALALLRPAINTIETDSRNPRFRLRITLSESTLPNPHFSFANPLSHIWLNICIFDTIQMLLDPCVRHPLTPTYFPVF